MNTKGKIRYTGLGSYTLCIAVAGLPAFYRGFDPHSTLALIAFAGFTAPLAVGSPDLAQSAAPRQGALRYWPALFGLLWVSAAVIVTAGCLVIRDAPGGSILKVMGFIITAFGAATGAAALAWRQVSRFAGRLVLESYRNAFAEQALEQELRSLRTEHRDIFMSQPTPMWIYDSRSLRILAVNDAACEQYRYSRMEMLGMSIMQLLPESEHAALQGYLEQRPRRSLQSAGVWTHCRKDGSLLHAEVVSHDMQWHGRAVRLVNSTDVTRLVATEQALREANAHLSEKVQERTLKVRRYARRLRQRKREVEVANRDLEMFSYSASHDLRTPLWVMKVFVDIILKDSGDKLPPEVLDSLLKVRAAAKDMTALVDDLMKLAKVSKRAVDRRVVDVTALVKAQIELLRNKDPQRDVQVDIAPGLKANVDEALLGIALENLLGNAWKYTAYVPKARIRVGAEDREGERVFFVEDNGAGFDMQDARELFKPFQRMHSDELFEGTGIGLAIVQRVVGLHGGAIWAEAAVNKGAKFFFRLGLDARRTGAELPYRSDRLLCPPEAGPSSHLLETS